MSMNIRRSIDICWVVFSKYRFFFNFNFRMNYFYRYDMICIHNLIMVHVNNVFANLHSCTSQMNCMFISSYI